MKLLTSEKFTLPDVYFISDRAEIKELPIGIPFIFGDAVMEEHLVRILEYEVLYQEAIRTGFPFNFKKILQDNGYTDLVDFYFYHPVYMELSTKNIDADNLSVPLTKFSANAKSFKQYIKDSVVYVDIQKLKALNVFPLWLDDIEKAIHTNIHNFAVYNNNMYNKKLEGMYGALDLVSPSKNLLVVDISGSIPKGVSSTLLALSKSLSESFYADLLITGSKSTLYAYEELYKLDIETIYEENGMDNDQAWFKKLLSSDVKKYQTAIVFGDHHNPGQSWSNNFNKGCSIISREDGKKLCKWDVEKVISFHTSSSSSVAGYASWFSPKETQHIEDWVKYLNS